MLLRYAKVQPIDALNADGHPGIDPGAASSLTRCLPMLLVPPVGHSSGAIAPAGMAAALRDEHTAYVCPQRFQSVQRYKG